MELTLKPTPPFDFHLTATHMYVLPPAKYSKWNIHKSVKAKI